MEELRIAVEKQNIVAVQRLLVDIKPNIDILHLALKSKNYVLVHIIISAGPIEPSDKTLTLACETNNEKIVKLVLSINAIPESSTITSALRTNNTTILEAILESITNIEIFMTTAAIDYALKCLSNDNVADDFKNAVTRILINTYSLSLTGACKTGNIELLNLSIKHGLRPDNHTLYEAYKSNNKSIILQVIAHGAWYSPIYRNKYKNTDYKTIYSFIVESYKQGKYETLDLMDNAAFNPDAYHDDYNMLTTFLSSYDCNSIPNILSLVKLLSMGPELYNLEPHKYDDLNYTFYRNDGSTVNAILMYYIGYIPEKGQEYRFTYTYVDSALISKIQQIGN